MDASNLNSEKLEFATLSLGKEGKVLRKIWSDKDIDALIQASGVLNDKPNDDDD